MNVLIRNGVLKTGTTLSREKLKEDKTIMDDGGRVNKQDRPSY